MTEELSVEIEAGDEIIEAEATDFGSFDEVDVTGDVDVVVEVVETEAPTAEVDTGTGEAVGTWVDYVERYEAVESTTEPTAEEPMIFERPQAGAEPGVREVEDHLQTPQTPEPAKAEEKPQAEPPRWRQRLGSVARSAAKSAARGAGKGLRRLASGLRKRVTAPRPRPTPKPIPRPKPQGGGQKPQTPKPASAEPRGQQTQSAKGFSTAQKLGRAAGSVLGAPRRTANGVRKFADGLRQGLPKGQRPSGKAALKPKAEEPSKAEAPRPKAKAEVAKKEGGDKSPQTPKPAPKGGAGGGGRSQGKISVSFPKLNLGGAAMAVLLVAAAGFLTAGGIANTAQAVSSLRPTPPVIIAAALLAATIMLALFRR